MKRFRDYDPARKDLWETHNRPWDYDHILPYAYTHNKKSNDDHYMYFCHKWRNTNGNFRVWPFEDNRSDQATPAEEKLNEIKLMNDSFINSDELNNLSGGCDVVKNQEKAIKFAEGCKSRIIRMYEEWLNLFSKTEDEQIENSGVNK